MLTIREMPPRIARLRVVERECLRGEVLDVIPHREGDIKVDASRQDDLIWINEPYWILL